MNRLTEYVKGMWQLEKTRNETCRETCETHECRNCPINEALEKLAEYENKEERWKNERRFPCHTGETVYCIVNGMILECHVVSFTVYGIATYVELESVPLSYPILKIHLNVEDLGEYWFLSKKEAEQKLKSEEEAKSERKRYRK